MNKSRTDLDRLFEKGISDVAREPRKSLSEEDLAAAAAASKSGAGVFLRSHTKEILLCTISFAAGCLVMIAVMHSSAPKSSEPQGNAVVTEVQVVDVDNDLDKDLDKDLDLNNQGKGVQTSEISNPTSRVQSTRSQIKNQTSHVTSPTSNVKNQTSQVKSQTSNVSHPVSDAPTDNSQLLTPNSPEPVVVKRTIVQRDTVVINETVIIKDTTYVP